jgi:hypothetical protein
MQSLLFRASSNDQSTCIVLTYRFAMVSGALRSLLVTRNDCIGGCRCVVLDASPAILCGDNPIYQRSRIQEQSRSAVTECRIVLNPLGR